MLRCPYYDCGWCYAPEGVDNNSQQGACHKPQQCPFLREKQDDS